MRAAKLLSTFTCWLAAIWVSLYLVYAAVHTSISADQALLWLAIDGTLVFIGIAIWTPWRYPQRGRSIWF
jgi:uncharacterized membrane protein